MQISEALTLSMAGLAGVMLGLLFFGGLWWTVQRGAASARAGLWFSVSFVLRTVVVLGGFYLVGAAHWPRLIACLVGFLAARMVVLRFTRSQSALASNAS